MKIIVYNDRKILERMTVIDYRGTRMMKVGEDWRGLQTTNLKYLSWTSRFLATGIKNKTKRKEIREILNFKVACIVLFIIQTPTKYQIISLPLGKVWLIM